MTPAEDYARGCAITLKLVREWTGDPPLFAFPPIPLMADLRDVGDRLARNQGARELLALLIKRCVERTGNAPTALMLQVTLETLGIEVEIVSFGELGIAAGQT